MDLERLMAAALDQARAAAAHGDVPIGAVVADEAGEIVAEAGNRREVDRDASAHAEILAIRAAGRRRGSWRLSGCAIVVTLEPCAMCAAAIVHARLDRIVFAAPDPKAGAIVSVFELASDARLNHRVPWTAGIARDESEALLRGFFEQRR